MKVLILKPSELIAFKDFQHPDLLYVISGSLSLHLSAYVSHDERHLETLTIEHGHYFDPYHKKFTHEGKTLEQVLATV